MWHDAYFHLVALPPSGLVASDCHIVATTAEALAMSHGVLPAAALRRVISCVLATNGSETRIALARAFVSLLDPDELADEIVRLLHRRPPRDAVAATFAALEDLDEAGKPAIRRLARDDDHELRWHAFHSLETVADDADVPLLLDGLGDAQFGVRWAAMRALVGLGEGAVRPLLLALTVRPPSRAFHGAAGWVLGRLLPRDDRTHELLVSLGRPRTVYESGALAFDLLRRREREATEGGAS